MARSKPAAVVPLPSNVFLQFKLVNAQADVKALRLELDRHRLIGAELAERYVRLLQQHAAAIVEMNRRGITMPEVLQ